MRKGRKRRDGHTSLRSFQIAEAVAHSGQPITLDHIARVTAIPKSTAHRIVSTLASEGILLREVGGKCYSAGERLLAMIVGNMSKVSFQTERRAILRGLVDQIGETCNFATLDGTDVIYVDRVEADWPLRLHLQPGSRVPIHCTAIGKTFLAHMRAAMRRRVLYGTHLARYTAKTVTDPVQLEKELVRIRKTRVAVDDGGYLAGLIAVAVPVFGRDRRVIASVAVHAPEPRLSLSDALRHVPLLKRAAADLGMMYRKLR